MGRREIREHIFKLLFLLQFHEANEVDEQAELYMDEVENAKPTPEESQIILDKFYKIEKMIPELDERISQTAKGWKTSRMGKVDLSILRLAVYEMQEDEEIPVGVAINEAVELAKKFGGEESSAFVNGVLAKLA